MRWAVFANDPTYALSGPAGEARFASVLLPARRYVVTSWLRPCTGVIDNCRTTGEAQARCTRSITVGGTEPSEIEVFAQDGQACRISVTR